MEIAATLPAHTPLRDVPGLARRIEALGFDTIHVPETIHDAFSVALLALEHTVRITVRTSMALAFTRSPMVVAYAAWDLARYSGGRFQLGLATQVRGNIVGRFSMPWGNPVERLADYLGALRAIFAAFQTGDSLHYEGPYYTFTRLQPYFNPGPLEVGPPAIYIGGVNRKMCRLAGGHADGFVTHATNSHPTYLNKVIIPELHRGARDASRPAAPRIVVVPKGIVAPSDAALAARREDARRELAFLYSTPAYHPTLSLFGFENLGAELTSLVRAEQWDRIESVLTDAVIDALIPQGTFNSYPQVLASRYRGLCEGIALDIPSDTQHDVGLAQMVANIRPQFLSQRANQP